MTVSSARPENLDAASDGLMRVSGGLSDAVDLVSRALAAYEASCVDAPLALVSPSRAGGSAGDARALGTATRSVAEAFRLADRDGADPQPVRTTDLDLAVVLATRFRGVDLSLLEPVEAARQQGRQAGKLVRAAADRGDPAAMAAVLFDLDRSLLANPVFAAAVLGELTAPQVEAVVEYLARVGEPAFPEPELVILSRLLGAAARLLDGPATLRPDRSLLTDLTRTAPGRGVLRILLSVHPGALPLRLVSLVVPALLLDHSFDDDPISGPLGSFLDQRPDGRDGALVAVLARTPGALRTLLVSPGTALAVDERVRRLVAATEAGAQEQLASLLRQVLGDQPGALANPGLRLPALRGLIAGAGDLGVDGITEPLAQLIAETIATDPGFYIGRADVAGRNDLRVALEAVTRFERPWITALDGIRAETMRRVLATLHQSFEVRANALADIGEILDEFEAAAGRSDSPRDPRRAEFAILAVAVRTGAGQLPVPLGPLGRLAANTGIDRALDAWHRSTTTDRGDHGPRTTADREALRHRIWLMVAADPAFARRVVWPTPGSGFRITGPEVLASLTGTDADVDDLAAWAALQPLDLRSIVGTYVDSTR